MEPELSLKAETLLLAIDPARGGLLTRRRKLRRALSAAARAEGGKARATGWSAYHAAQAELLGEGLVTVSGLPRRLELVDRAPAGRRFAALKRGAASGDFGTARQQELFVLLAGCGVLARRMAGGERRIARRRLSSLVPPPNESIPEPTYGVATLGLLAAAGFGHFDDGGGDSGWFGGDGGGGGAGFDTGGGGDGGGGDGGGGQ